MPSPHKGRRLALYHWALMALGLIVGGGGGTWAVLELVVWNRLPAELVGTWEVQEGPMQGGTFQFFRAGALEVRAKDEIRDFNLQAQVALQDRDLLTTTRNPRTGAAETRKSQIRELTGQTLVLELENGEILKMVRK